MSPRLRPLILGAAVALSAGLAACESDAMTASETATPSLRDVTEAQWAALRTREIFFGHQSVGNNLIEGLQTVLGEHPAIGLTVVESKDLAPDQPPALHHALVGRNNYPLEKMDEFVDISTRGFGAAGGLAMVKLCFEDVHPDTDAGALFAQYRERMRSLQAARPELTVVHFTMPLTETENLKGLVIKKIRGLPLERDRNVVRNRYNRLLREAYEGKEPLFDIARLESTLPDGSRSYFQRGADTVFVLADQYSSDGGHLNPDGQRRMAEQLLVLLARLDS